MPSFLMTEILLFCHAGLSVKYKGMDFCPLVSFADTAPCGGEFQRLTFWEPLAGFSFCFSMTNYLTHILFLIIKYVHARMCVCIHLWYHPIPSWSLICYTKEDHSFFSSLEGYSLFLNYIRNPTVHLFHTLPFSYPTYGVNKMHTGADSSIR